MQWDAIIIGAGAAGLWAAGTAAERGRRVLLLEKNSKSGVKILMSGGTRCNITHDCDNRRIAEAFGRAGRALLGPLSQMSPVQVRQIFADLGVETKVEETGKVFPVSDRAIDVRDALLRRIEQAGGEVRNNAAVCGIDAAEEGFTVAVDDKQLRADRVLITTGGLSYSGCGTTGDGYPWAQKFGHTVTPRRPALTPLLSSAAWVHELSGLTLDDVSIQARLSPSPKQDAKLERSASRGGFLWTHFGCSGPTAMNVSRCFSDLASFKETAVQIDVLPDEPEPRLLEWLTASQRDAGQKSIGAVLHQRLPKRVVGLILQRSGVEPERRMAELPKKAVQAIVEHSKRLTVPVHGTRGYPKAEVTAGGVALSEVNFQTMESRIQPGLFFAGEILDLDGPIGGFNFQAAWATGHVAGLNM